MAAMKINLTKLACTINANAIRVIPTRKFLHENLSYYESFFTRKFPDLWYFSQKLKIRSKDKSVPTEYAPSYSLL